MHEQTTKAGRFYHTPEEFPEVEKKAALATDAQLAEKERQEIAEREARERELREAPRLRAEAEKRLAEETEARYKPIFRAGL
jgi:hypothetical protein